MITGIITDAANAYPRTNDCGFDPRAAIELVDPKVDFSRYQRLVLVLPDHNCGWAGQAQVAPTGTGPVSPTTTG